MYEQMADISRGMKILAGIKGNSRIKKIPIEMIHIFHRLMLGLNIAKKRIKKVENILIENFQTESQRETKRQYPEKSRNCGAVAKKYIYDEIIGNKGKKNIKNTGARL